MNKFLLVAMFLGSCLAVDVAASAGKARINMRAVPQDKKAALRECLESKGAHISSQATPDNLEFSLNVKDKAVDIVNGCIEAIGAQKEIMASVDIVLMPAPKIPNFSQAA